MQSNCQQGGFFNEKGEIDPIHGTWKVDENWQYCECGKQSYSQYLTLPAGADCPTEPMHRDFP